MGFGGASERIPSGWQLNERQERHCRQSGDAWTEGAYHVAGMGHPHIFQPANRSRCTIEFSPNQARCTMSFRVAVLLEGEIAASYASASFCARRLAHKPITHVFWNAAVGTSFNCNRYQHRSTVVSTINSASVTLYRHQRSSVGINTDRALNGITAG